MPEVIGVSFNEVAKSYWFDPAGYDPPYNSKVLVETVRGEELGTVRIPKREVPEEEIQYPLKRVLRIADSVDLARVRENASKAEHALKVCWQSVHHLELPMRLLKAEYCFDASQVTIFFSAEGRVDFRELVKEVASQLHCKVQLHQVGARDQAKVVGGVGPCGKGLCCATFLTDFAAISMKMAKDQSLFLNPVKFSGLCGKLMCCLRYEHDLYVDAKNNLPDVGAEVSTPRGAGTVESVNVIKNEVSVLIHDTKVCLAFPVADIRVLAPARCESCSHCGKGDLLLSDEDISIEDSDDSA